MIEHDEPRQAYTMTHESAVHYAMGDLRIDPNAKAFDTAAQPPSACSQPARWPDADERESARLHPHDQ